jgi:hypothetical protein
MCQPFGLLCSCLELHPVVITGYHHRQRMCQPFRLRLANATYLQTQKAGASAALRPLAELGDKIQNML